MSYYNKVKYGERLYGTDGDTDSRQLWGFIVDWDDDGYYTGENEGERMIDFVLRRGREHYIQPNGNGFERYQPGEVSAVFDNYDGRYDPYNTSSPLYPNVSPGKFVRIMVKDGTLGTNYNIMRGKIYDIQQFSEGRQRYARIIVKDGLQFLADSTVTTHRRNNAQIATIGRDILRACDWPEAEWPTLFRIGTETIDYFWLTNYNALRAFNELVDIELGAIYHNRFGQLELVPADYTYNTLTTVNEADVLADIIIPQPWEVIRNNIEIRTHPKKLFTFSPMPTIWENQDAPAMPTGTTVEAEMLFKYEGREVAGSNVAFSVDLNTFPDGSGGSISPYVLVEVDPPGSGQLSGGRTKVSVTNNSGIDGYLYELIATGNVVYSAYDSAATAKDTASIKRYGNKSLVIDSPWQWSMNYAKAAANFLLAELKDPRIYPIIQVENRPTLQWTTDLYVNVFNLILPTFNLNANYRVGYIEHKWLRQNGQAVRTTYKLEPYLNAF
jgi:hypothetical protein